MKDNFKNDKFAKLVGIKIIESGYGHAAVELEIIEDHKNGLDLVHGGVIFTLADYAFAVASNSNGFATVGVNINITYFKSPVGKIIHAKANEINTQNKLCSYQVNIYDEDDSLIACFNGLGYRKEILIK